MIYYRKEMIKMNEGKIIYRVVNGEYTYLMLSSDNNTMDLFYTIHSTNIRYIIEHSDETRTQYIKVIILYWDSQGKQILEIFNLNLENKKVYHVEKKVVNNIIKLINPTTFYYNDEHNFKNILSFYGEQLQPQTISNMLCNRKFKVTDVTLGEYCLEDNTIEIVLHIGNIEKLHLLLVSPTSTYQSFKVYRRFYSELTDKIIDILSSENHEEEYLTFERFVMLFTDSNLVTEVSKKEKEHGMKVRQQVLALKK